MNAPYEIDLNVKETLLTKCDLMMACILPPHAKDIPDLDDTMESILEDDRYEMTRCGFGEWVIRYLAPKECLFLAMEILNKLNEYGLDENKFEVEAHPISRGDLYTITIVAPWRRMPIRF